MVWAANGGAVLGLTDGAPMRGRAFALLVDPEHAGSRYDAMTGGAHVAPESEVKYRIQYRFLPEGRRRSRRFGSKTSASAASAWTAGPSSRKGCSA